MKRTAIMKGTPPCQAPEQISEKVQAVSQIVNFDGKEILNMDLFYMGKLRGRYFADKEEKTHAAFADGKWYSCMINNVARVCQNLETIKGDGYYYGDNWEFVSKEDKQTALGYLGTYNVINFEVGCNQLKYERAYQRKCKRIDEIMGKIPCVPDAMEDWVQQEILPGNYLFFKKRQETYGVQLNSLRRAELEKERLETRRDDHLPKVRRICESVQQEAGTDSKSPGDTLAGVRRGMGRAAVPGGVHMESRGDKRGSALRGGTGHHPQRRVLGKGILWYRVRCG